ncbi:hypothetical protein P0082_01820 [Candidatus Haliotispira prima]|uniref:Glycerol-3-phosphate acyltransferase n=1 Tax=Candidatus Haliotispira prima TaxID=3034016 RepID=A0ABY8MKA4_9SPIO|nr:hypothetical protein P0082_01820 [Candidatus Haliotispira prima]
MEIREDTTFLELFTPIIREIMANPDIEIPQIDATNVYSPGVPFYRNSICDIAGRLMLPGSGLRNTEQFIELWQRCQKGESCLIMMEHYSNFDFPALLRFFEHTPGLGIDAANALLPIQAYKLTSGNQATPVLSCAYSTITIYPSRHIDQIKDEDEKQRVREISTPMNHAAIGEMTKRKYQGRIILVFPTGTRYRPWNPDSKRAVREAESYLKVFRNVLFVGLNGFCLIPSPDENMENDLVEENVVLMTAGNIVRGRQFRDNLIQQHQLEADLKTTDKKQIKDTVCAAIMEELAKLHNEAEPVHKKLQEEARNPENPFHKHKNS